MSDKEYHFQNWFRDRLTNLGKNFEVGGRNSYPDFRFVKAAEGFELKGLAYPGRSASFDCNSQIPCGEHNGRQILYVFGRYPSNPDGNSYPVLDLVMCHGSFLNADSFYQHKNRSFQGLGSYGDILVRDRKMYVVPTPYTLAEGTAHRRTLILPVDWPVESDLEGIGDLTRKEVEWRVEAYKFNLSTNELATEISRKPGQIHEHVFRAYRVKGDPMEPLALRESARNKAIETMLGRMEGS